MSNHFLLGYQFKDCYLYELSLKHSSLGSQKKKTDDNKTPNTERLKVSEKKLEDSGVSVSSDESNERLEFLGDRILGLVIAESLYQEFPEDNEGLLSIKLAQLVNRYSLGSIARRHGLDILLKERLNLQDGELTNNGSIISDAMEAVIAAVYLDGGWHEAREFVLRLWGDSIELLRNKGIDDIRDKKTQLQEFCQKRGVTLPEYILVEKGGTDHEPKFIVEVKLEEEIVSRGVARSKKQAEQEAARIAMEILTKNEDG